MLQTPIKRQNLRSVGGWANDMTRSDRRFDLKRARSAPMAVLLSRNAAAISGVVRPPNMRKVKATRDLGSNAGWQQVKIRRRPLTAILSDSVSSDLASKAISAARRASRAPVRSRSMALRSATFSNQPRGLSGKPALPQCLRQGSSGSAQSRSTLQSSLCGRMRSSSSGLPPSPMDNVMAPRRLGVQNYKIRKIEANRRA